MEWREHPATLIPRPAQCPPLRERLPVLGLLVAASLANLPVVYLLLQRADTEPLVVLGVGLVAMGLAWAAGFHVQAKRPRLVQALIVPGLAEAGLAFVPGYAAARPFVLGTAALSLAGLFLAWRRG